MTDPLAITLPLEEVKRMLKLAIWAEDDGIFDGWSAERCAPFQNALALIRREIEAVEALSLTKPRSMTHNPV